MDTCRLWTKTDLETIKKHENNELITTFMNVKTFTADEIKVYPYVLRKIYLAWFDEGEPVEFYATDDKTAVEFFKDHYNTDNLVSIERKITTYKPVYERKEA